MPWSFIIKLVAGIIIFPLTVAWEVIWPWWCKTNLFFKIITGPVVLPIAGFLFYAAPWYNGLE